jgi:hypothetical protein
VDRLKGATQKTKRNPVNAPKAGRIARPTREVVACEWRAGRHNELGRLGQIPGEIQIGN